jgi:hypothetical protein
MDEQPTSPDDLSEEELRAAYEEQLKQVRVEDVVIQTIVSLLNLGGRKAGLAPGTEDERDPQQLRQAIEATRVLLPLVEELLGPDAKQLRDVLSQLQMAYAQQTPGGAPGAAPAGDPAPAANPDDPGPAQSSGRLWVPGQ